MKTMLYRRRWFFFPPLIVGGLVLFGFVTMALWNALLPEIFGLPVINFWQAAGMLVLARLFFGGGPSKWHNHREPYMNRDLRDKIKNMSPEQKREFFRKMHYSREKWQHGCCDEKVQKTEDENPGN